jgi:hypothetical protein
MNAPVSRLGASCAVIFLAAVTACSDRHTEPSASVSPAAQVVGVAPAPASGDTPFTTPVAPGTTEVAKPVEVGAMPLPGQPNDHSNIALLPSQKAETAVVLKDPDLAKAANADPLELSPEQRAKVKQVVPPARVPPDTADQLKTAVKSKPN